MQQTTKVWLSKPLKNDPEKNSFFSQIRVSTLKNPITISRRSQSPSKTIVSRNVKKEKKNNLLWTDPTAVCLFLSTLINSCLHFVYVTLFPPPLHYHSEECDVNQMYAVFLGALFLSSLPGLTLLWIFFYRSVEAASKGKDWVSKINNNNNMPTSPPPPQTKQRSLPCCPKVHHTNNPHSKSHNPACYSITTRVSPWGGLKAFTLNRFPWKESL